MKCVSAICLGTLLLFAAAPACSDPGSEGDGGPSGDTEQLAVAGEDLYQENCSACHGADLKGTSAGPPFLSPIYAPNHHSDEAFFLAVANGVQPHHWEFGPMPPQPGVSEEDVAAIVAFVREQQEEAGITEDPSHP